MLIQVVDTNNKVLPVDLDPNDQFDNLAALIEAQVTLLFPPSSAEAKQRSFGQQWGIKMENQRLFFNSRPIDLSRTLSDYGVYEGATILLATKKYNSLFLPQLIPPFSNCFETESQSLTFMPLSNQPPRNQHIFSGNDFSKLIFLPQTGNPQEAFKQKARMEANKLREFYLNNPDELNMILHQNRPFAEMIVNEDMTDLIKYMEDSMKKTSAQKREHMERMRQLYADPMNPENQKMIEEEIRRENIEENMSMAEEYMPESFTRVTMLYVEISVNKYPIQAFVDSGAQSTIMSKNCAERSGLMRLLDRRFAGIAVGVGSTRILGRVHVCDMQIMDKVLFPLLCDHRVGMVHLLVCSDFCDGFGR